jgi:site-specific DNA-methyltransferase (adenine-specific)
VCFQVKGGKVQSKDIDALFGVVGLEKYHIGVLLTRYEPSKPMRDKAAQAGLFEAAYGYQYPKIQILTLAEFFAGKALNLPSNNVTFKSAATVSKSGQQNGFL